MAEPFVFHFKPGPDSEPLQMYICDVLGRCGLCGARQIQRFYHAASFHRLTVSRLEQLARQGLEKLDTECENCGTAVGADCTTMTVLTWGFADDSGTLTSWVTPDGACVWSVAPNRRLDPQTLPGFEPPEQPQQLTDDWVEEHLGRVLNTKQLWIELFDHVDDEPGAAFETAATDYLIAVSDEPLDGLFDSDDWVISLDGEPSSPFLPFHETADDLFASPIGWLSEARRKQLRDGQRFAAASVSADQIRGAIERAFAVANITFAYDPSERIYSDIKTPTEVAFGHPLPLLAVAQRAVYTGITPGEAARLSAEEIVGTLLRVWSES